MKRIILVAVVCINLHAANTQPLQTAGQAAAPQKATVPTPPPLPPAPTPSMQTISPETQKNVTAMQMQTQARTIADRANAELADTIVKRVTEELEKKFAQRIQDQVQAALKAERAAATPKK